MAGSAPEVHLLLSGPTDAPLEVFIEPFNERIVVPAGEHVRLTLAGDLPSDGINSALIWNEWGLTVWPGTGLLARKVTFQSGTVVSLFSELTC